MSLLSKIFSILSLSFLIAFPVLAQTKEEVQEQCVTAANGEAIAVLQLKAAGGTVEQRFKEVYPALKKYPEFWVAAQVFIKAVYEREHYEAVKEEYEAVVKACVKALYKSKELEV